MRKSSHSSSYTSPKDKIFDLKPNNNSSSTKRIGVRYEGRGNHHQSSTIRHVNNNNNNNNGGKFKTHRRQKKFQNRRKFGSSANTIIKKSVHYNLPLGKTSSCQKKKKKSYRMVKLSQRKRKGGGRRNHQRKSISSMNYLIKTNARYHPLKQFFQRSSEKDNSSQKIPYHKQSNPYFEKPLMKRKRKRLKNNPILRKRIEKLVDGIYEINENGEIDKDEYVRVHTRITKTLYDEDSTYVRRKRMAGKDWIKDSNQKNSMKKEGLMDALFELVDLWTNSVNIKDYVVFVDSLYIKLKYPDSFNNFAYDILSSV